MTNNPNQDAFIKLVLYAANTYMQGKFLTKAEVKEALEECAQYVERDTADALYQFLKMQ